MLQWTLWVSLHFTKQSLGYMALCTCEVKGSWLRLQVLVLKRLLQSAGNHCSQPTEHIRLVAWHCTLSGVAEKCQHHRILPPISWGFSVRSSILLMVLLLLTHTLSSTYYQPGVWYTTMESKAIAMSVLRAFLRNQGKQDLSLSLFRQCFSGMLAYLAWCMEYMELHFFEWPRETLSPKINAMV